MTRIKFIIILVMLGSRITALAQIPVSELESKWRSMYHKGYEYFNNKQYDVAVDQFENSVILLKEQGAENTNYYIYSLLKLGETYSLAGQTNKANDITNILINVRDKIKPASKRFMEYLINMGVYFSSTKDYITAIKYLNEALEHEEILSKIQNGKAQVYNRLALCKYCQNRIQEAIEYQKLCVGSDMSQTPDYIKTLAYYYYKSGEWESLESIIKNCFDCSREPILRKFTQSKSKDRAKYWSETGLFFTHYIPTYAYEHPSELLAGIAYDAALFGKGVLLAADKKSTELTLTSDDNELVERYAHYLKLKRKKSRTLDEEFEIQALSDVFLRYQKEHKNEFKSEFRLSWKDVQNKLKEGEIAIEFITIPGEDGVEKYASLSIKKTDRAPKLTQLCDFNQIASIPSDLLYITPELYNLIWGKLDNELSDVQSIYFSPAGVFYNTGIEYLPNEDGINLSSIKNLYRLSSTKEIVMSKPAKTRNIVLFGGVDYDTPITELAKESSEYVVAVNEGRTVPLDSLDLRGAATEGGFKYLAGTSEEVKEISTLLSDTDMGIDVYSGHYGSEASFKNMSGKDIDVLHIATHGFYYSSPHTGNSTSIEKLFIDLNLYFRSDDIEIVNEDKMLTRSGLILAGANNILRKVPIPYGVEDGVLYADEIANLDFNCVNLLVMSACQSGLGDNHTSEGVFGLQRGFKLAGVESIVMSLWKVNDISTEYFMTEMYKNIALGQSKREAFNNAQISLRMKNAGEFDLPEYWAAFVLLDALD